jgi:hypothetical protein
MPIAKANINPSWLAERLEQSPFKQKAIAKLCKVSEFTLSRWKAGITRIPEAKVQLLEHVLDWGEAIAGAGVPSHRKELPGA